jgi:hypothetical protein
MIIGPGDGFFSEIRRRADAKPFPREYRIAMTGFVFEAIDSRTCSPEEIREV